ncbi:cupin domain-containing protein [Aspergillus ibericus CBS 121593]|uniref:Cupin type-2 domain-containing protein n=1 Tax=Aspergillus ibericus CBS 121593 TaxID=1448316 RepID=A0A395GS22_9EURO|nr:hypothetical protein BO80DRAFT_427526 [Aspergillus ibericus CBS 121593]RAK98229.1 hypothetical protein BO80DRAFT_427526 [Aspergillus ibericus CBS 121593]
MAHYITTNDANGVSVFSKVPDEQFKISVPVGEIRILSSAHSFPLDLSSEADIEQYQKDRTSTFFPGSSRRIVPDGGTSTIMITMEPGAESPMHRTMTSDTVVVIEGEIESTLDSGETRILKAGDVLVQRATMHKWRNVTADNGRAKMVAFAQSTAEPLQIGDKVLSNEWLN